MNLTSLPKNGKYVVTAKIGTKDIDFIVKLIEVKNYDTAIISLSYKDKRLNFKNVVTDFLYIREDEKPVLWKDVRICGGSDDQYKMHCDNEGVALTRRETFRVGMSVDCIVDTCKERDLMWMLRDLSETGFSVTSSLKNAVDVPIGYPLTVDFCDNGKALQLMGNIVRIQKTDKHVIYGCKMTREVKGLQAFIVSKQRKSVHR